MIKDNFLFGCLAFVEISWQGNTEEQRQEKKPNLSNSRTAKHKAEIRRKRNKIERRENVKKKKREKNRRKEEKEKRIEEINSFLGHLVPSHK